jgi:hypothetical protein
LRTILQERDDWHLWVLEFGITHFLMRLALHTGMYHRHIRIECVGCLRFEVDVQGGPYRLVLEPIDWHGRSAWELRSTSNTFRLVYGTVSRISRVEAAQ